MRVYIAAFYQASSKAYSVHQRITSANHIHQWMLESYHYSYRRPEMVQAIRDHDRTIFLDSGAFSASTQGIKIDVEHYGRYLNRFSDVVDVAANLDVIKAGHEKDSYDNLKKLENIVGRDVVLPVHHVRDKDRWLKKYLDEGYQHIALGGMVPESTPDLRSLLDRLWSQYLCNRNGTAKVKVHGFGLTTEELMNRYPWHSVDSTSWVKYASFGIGLLDLPQPDGSVQRRRINFSERSDTRFDPDSQHYQSLSPDDQENIRQRLNELEAAAEWKAAVEWKAYQRLKVDFRIKTGFDLAYTPEALSKSYGLLRVLNMDYFARMADRFSVSKFAHAA
jgi:hypothetical protein